MCLLGVDFAVNFDGVGRAYKVYEEREGGLRYASNRENDDDLFIKLLKGEWVSAKNSYIEIQSDAAGLYRPGFHMFLNLEDCGYWWPTENCIVFEVEYKDILAFGTQDASSIMTVNNKTVKCVVANQMRFCKQISVEELKNIRTVYSSHVFRIG